MTTTTKKTKQRKQEHIQQKITKKTLYDSTDGIIKSLNLCLSMNVNAMRLLSLHIFFILLSSMLLVFLTVVSLRKAVLAFAMHITVGTPHRPRKAPSEYGKFLPFHGVVTFLPYHGFHRGSKRRQEKKYNTSERFRIVFVWQIEFSRLDPIFFSFLQPHI